LEGLEKPRKPALLSYGRESVRNELADQRRDVLRARKKKKEVTDREGGRTRSQKQQTGEKEN